jgi:catechol 2,3-dioxygenase-like lactoylglutathione lyase family enzyme
VIVVTVVQVNFIVADLERSRSFYAILGFTFIARNRHGEGLAEAWVSTNTGITVVLHSTAFASWWDETAPEPSAGGPQVDIEFESLQRLDEVLDKLESVGAKIVKPPADMPWGQRFAVVLDPDGYRVGLKAPARQERPAAL